MEIDKQDYEWYLVAEKDGEKVASYDCPREAIGDIVKIMVKAELGETCLPNSAMRKDLQRIIDKNELYKEVIIKVTGIDEGYIQRFLSGASEPLDIDKLTLLTKIIDPV